MSSANKVWLVTGSSSGFGRCIAEELINRGARVVATARNPRTLDELVAKAPEQILPLPLDVTQPADIVEAVSKGIQKFGVIDVLVNNAGYSVVGAVEETSEQELRDAMETMFFGAVSLTQALLPHMRQRGSGTIVQISSVGGFITAPGFGLYCAAKHALEALSESLAAEVAPLGIRVLIVEPGAFRTSLFGPAFRTMPPMEAYAESVGATRAYVEQSAGRQDGDPKKAARAIIDAVEAGAPNLRLPLGPDAVAGIRQKLAVVTNDIDASEAVALSTSFHLV